jgi:hypothetical protein
VVTEEKQAKLHLESTEVLAAMQLAATLDSHA